MDIRLASIPVDHIEAEIATFPLTSEDAFRFGVTSLDPDMKDKTDELWLAAESDLLNKFPSLSIDEGVALRDYHWFNNNPATGKIKLYEYLFNLAGRNLKTSGRYAIPFQHDDREISSPLTPDEARWSLRWLTFAVPADLLLSALSLNNNHLPAKISQFSPHLFKMLEDRHFSEPHLHINAGMDFCHAWASLMWSLADYKNLKPKDFHSPGAFFNDGKNFGKWLIRSAVIRYILAEFLTSHQKNEILFDFLIRQIDTGSSDLFKIMGTADYLSKFRQIICELCAGKLDSDLSDSQDFSYWQPVYAALIQPARGKITFEDLQSLDPICVFFPNRQPDEPTPEMLFTCAGLNYMCKRDKKGTPDALFECLFWQVQRVRIFFYRHVTQRPMTPGLLWFIRFYSRLRPARIPYMATRIQTAARVDGLCEGLKSFEIRTAPSAKLKEIVDDLNDVIDGFNKINYDVSKGCGVGAATDNENSNDVLRDVCTPYGSPLIQDAGLIKNMPVECAVIYHFPKGRGGGAAKGTPKAFWKDSNAEPLNDAKSGDTIREFFRYERHYKNHKDSAIVLAKLILHNPYILNTIRGIDICTDELGVPTWVFVPIFRYLRKSSEIAATVTKSVNFTNMTLRTTVHAGEDFVHLATGLRKVDEIRRFLKLSDGDRIGHGMSLGVEPVEWAKRTCSVLMSKEDRLMDLLWEYKWYVKDGLNTSADRSLYLEHRIIVLGTEIFGGRPEKRQYPLSAKDLLDFYKCLNDEECLKCVGFPDSPWKLEFYKCLHNKKCFKCVGFPDRAAINDPDFPNSPRNLIMAYLTDRNLFQRGRKLIRVEPKHDVEALVSLQRAVKKALGRLNITVEVNPSSNLLIGNLADFKNHPLWRIMPVDETSEEPVVSICIGSDDPLTFNTNIRMEYQYLSDALARAGFSEERRSLWLDKVRRNGLDSRFTLPYRGSHARVYDYEDYEHPENVSTISLNLPEPDDMP